MKLLVVTASVREGRVGEKVTNWFAQQVKSDGRFDLEIVDLKKLNLSYELSEQPPSQVEGGQYSREEDREWAKKVDSADAVVFVSPEYNHGYPASLKNAVDHLFSEWNNKPVAFVGYGASGAPYSQAAFALVAAWVKMDLVGARVGISEIWAAFDENGELNFADYYEHQAKGVLESLASKATTKVS